MMIMFRPMRWLCVVE